MHGDGVENLKRIVSRSLAWGLLGAVLSFPARAITPVVPRSVVTLPPPIGRKGFPTPTRTPTPLFGKVLVATSPTPTKPPHSREIVIGFTGSTPAQSREIQIDFVGKPLSPGGVRKP
ncbi:MAG TPA: hypothetical protein VGK70_00225 [Thermoanaerobaculia bacterium]